MTKTNKPVINHFDCGTYVGSHIGKEIKHSIGDEPPKREWVGLTIEDAQDVIKQAMHSLTNDSNTFTLSGNMIWVAIVNEVEAKLKEKNT